MTELKEIDRTIYDDYYFRDVDGHDSYYVFSRVKTLIVEYFRNRVGNVLDVGFGRGEMLAYLSGLGWSGMGIDCSESAIRKASEVVGGRNITLKQMLVTQLDLPWNNYDLVLFLNVWEHLNTEEVTIFLRDLRRYMKNDSFFIIQTSPTKWQTTIGKFFLKMFGVTPASEQWHINEQTLFSLKKSLSSAGFGGKVWLERMPGFWSAQVGRKHKLLFLTASFLDYVLDNTVFGSLADSFPLKLFFATDIWAVIKPKLKSK